MRMRGQRPCWVMNQTLFCPRRPATSSLLSGTFRLPRDQHALAQRTEIGGEIFGRQRYQNSGAGRICSAVSDWLRRKRRRDHDAHTRWPVSARRHSVSS